MLPLFPVSLWPLSLVDMLSWPEFCFPLSSTGVLRNTWDELERC